MARPLLLIVAGSNGAGKSTFAVPYAAARGLPFLNADELTRKYKELGESQALVKAAREFLATVDDYIARGESVCIETTLSGGYVHGVAARARAAGFRVELVYLFVESVEVAVSRVSTRVRKGGHHVPETDVRRRFARSLRNFDRLSGEVDGWRLFASANEGITLAAEKRDGKVLTFSGDALQTFRNLPRRS